MAPRVAVIGSGYVGTVVAAGLGWLGRDVSVVETEPGRLSALRRGDVPFFEPRLAELLRDSQSAGTLRFTEAVGEALDGSDVVFLCVGTPTGADGRVDMSAVAAAATEIGRHLCRPQVLVTKSTVPVGTGQWLTALVRDGARGRHDIDGLLSVVSCPEFLREGSAVNDFLHPDRVVLGGDDASALTTVADVYAPILAQDFPGARPERRPVLVQTGLVTAEMIKYASNAFLATKISFVNEVAGICEAVGADITEVSHAMGLDSRIGAAFLDAGVGWGGSCFGKDLSELIRTAADFGRSRQLLQAVVDVNIAQRSGVISRLRGELGSLRGRQIALLGLAFKPGTDDLRDAPALDIARDLIAAGATVCAHDPTIDAVPNLQGLRIATTASDAVRDADAVVLVTEWPEYGNLPWSHFLDLMRGDIIVDGRNALEPEQLQAAGFRYLGVGRPAGRRQAPARGRLSPTQAGPPVPTDDGAGSPPLVTSAAVTGGRRQTPGDRLGAERRWALR